MTVKRWFLVVLFIVLAFFILWFGGFWPRGSKPADQLILEGEGIYVGQIDNNSVEIIIDNQPKAFGLDPEVSVAGIKDGSTVIFTYSEDGTRPVLLSIKAIEADIETLQGEGIFTGQIDSHSVEIVVDKQAMVFALDKNVSLDKIEDGSRVVFSYRKEETRPLLLFIEMIESPVGENDIDLVGEGILEGQIDTQSVEILLSRVFILSDGVSADGIADGSLVVFTYSENGQRAILDSLQAVDEPIEGAVAHGILIGQGDSLSVEIQYYRAFVLGEGVSVEGIADGSEVIFTYQEGIHRPVLTSIIAK